MRVRWTLRPRGARVRRRDNSCGAGERASVGDGSLVCGLGRLPVGWIARLPSPSRLYRATCLAVARSRNGSCVINAIHYRPAVSLPKVRGCLKFPSPFGKVDCEARRMRSHNYRLLNLIRRSLCSRHLPQRGRDMRSPLVVNNISLHLVFCIKKAPAWVLFVFSLLFFGYTEINRPKMARVISRRNPRSPTERRIYIRRREETRIEKEHKR